MKIGFFLTEFPVSRGTFVINELLGLQKAGEKVIFGMKQREI